MTLGKDGALLFERGQSATWIPPWRVENAHGVGAGDTFTACLALALAAGAEIRMAAELATTAASLAVGKARVSDVHHGELLAALACSPAEAENDDSDCEPTLIYSRGW